MKDLPSLSQQPIFAQAPSNIALVKYMGKEDAAANIPSNPSLSMTLSGLRTVVEVSLSPEGTRWVPELPRTSETSNARVPWLGDHGIAKILKHVERLRAELPATFSRLGLEADFSRRFEIRSSNNFPEASGIASSASSFAALTLGVAAAFSRDLPQFQSAFDSDPTLKRALAQLSRKGSGSSCRSFEGAWVLWDKEDAASIEVTLPEMTDLVLLISSQAKRVSSSEAHSWAKTSPLWEGRSERASERTRNLEAALAEGDFKEVSRIAWAELWEMHSLFHTCAEPFTYWEPDTLKALQFLAGELKAAQGNPPIVTMDAGANVHVLVPTNDAEAWERKLRQALPDVPILSDRQGQGASLLRSTPGREAR